MFKRKSIDGKKGKLEAELRAALQRRLRVAYEFRKAYAAAIDKAMNQCIFIRIEGIVLNASSGLTLTRTNRGRPSPYDRKRDTRLRNSVNKRLSSVVEGTEEVNQAKKAKIKFKFGKSKKTTTKSVTKYLQDVKRDSREDQRKQPKSKNCDLDNQVKELEQSFLEASQTMPTRCTSVWDSVKTGSCSNSTALDKSLYEQLTASDDNDTNCCSPCKHCPPCSTKKKASQDLSLKRPLSDPGIRQNNFTGSIGKDNSIRPPTTAKGNTSRDNETTDKSVKLQQPTEKQSPFRETKNTLPSPFKPDSGSTKGNKKSTYKKSFTSSSVDPDDSQSSHSSHSHSKKSNKSNDTGPAGSAPIPIIVIPPKKSQATSSQTSKKFDSKRPSTFLTQRDESPRSMASRNNDFTFEKSPKQISTAGRKPNPIASTSSFTGSLEYGKEDPDVILFRQRASKGKALSKSDKGKKSSPDKRIKSFSDPLEIDDSKLDLVKMIERKRPDQNSKSSPDKRIKSFSDPLEIDDSKLDLVKMIERKRPDQNSHSNVCNDWSNPRFLIDDISPPYNHQQQSINIRILQYELWKAQEHMASLKRINSFLKERNGPATETEEQLQRSGSTQGDVIHYFLTSFVAALIVGILTGKFIF